MSSAPDLTNSASIMVSLGVISQKQADETEHCVDDAVDLLSTLTAVINNNPTLALAFKSAVKEDAYKDLNNEYQYEYIGKDKTMLSSHILPNCDDLVIEEQEGAIFKEVVVSSKKLEINKIPFAYKTGSDIYYIIKDSTDNLNYSNDFGNGK